MYHSQPLGGESVAHTLRESDKIERKTNQYF